MDAELQAALFVLFILAYFQLILLLCKDCMFLLPMCINCAFITVIIVMCGSVIAAMSIYSLSLELVASIGLGALVFNLSFLAFTACMRRLFNQFDKWSRRVQLYHQDVLHRLYWVIKETGTCSRSCGYYDARVCFSARKCSTRSCGACTGSRKSQMLQFNKCY